MKLRDKLKSLTSGFWLKLKPKSVTAAASGSRAAALGKRPDLVAWLLLVVLVFVEGLVLKDVVLSMYSLGKIRSAPDSREAYRINFDAYDRASKRFESGVGYQPKILSVHNPFRPPVEVKALKKK